MTLHRSGQPIWLELLTKQQAADSRVREPLGIVHGSHPQVVTA